MAASANPWVDLFMKLPGVATTLYEREQHGQKDEGVKVFHGRRGGWIQSWIWDDRLLLLRHMVGMYTSGRMGLDCAQLVVAWAM